jgi:hypothetical protein
MKAIRQFLLNETIWMFLAAIILISILLVVETDAPGWGLYLSFLGFFALLYAPVLLFSLFRQKLRKGCSLRLYRSIWIGVFLLYPILIVFLTRFAFLQQAMKIFTNHIAMSSEADGTLAVVSAGSLSVFVVEMAIQSNRFFSQKTQALDWLKKLGLEKTILVLMLLFSFLIMAIDYSERYDFPRNLNELLVATPVFVSHSLQFFLILLIYYSFYWINHYLLINHVLKQKGVLYYGFGLMGTVLLLYPIAAQLISWIPMVQQLGIHPVVKGSVFEGINASIPLIGMILSIPFILTFQWFKQRSEIAALDKEKSETELILLKQQINPHFFFNTLNNLYALSIKKDKATPEVILRLSELMRYVIYKGKEQQVKLAEEIKYLKDYISLQQIRLHKQLDFQFEQEIEDDQIQFSPLLFIILVENAFKHGIEVAENEAFLHLYLKSNQNQLVFCCMNSVEGPSTQPPGIGLRNLRRRLDLLYPKRHHLSLEQNDFTYKATLEIQLS